MECNFHMTFWAKSDLLNYLQRSIKFIDFIIKFILFITSFDLLTSFEAVFREIFDKNVFFCCNNSIILKLNCMKIHYRKRIIW